MSFILVPSHGEDIKVNAWNWRPTLELLRVENLVRGEDFEPMGSSGSGAKVDAELALRIAAVIERKHAVSQSGQRMLADLSVTSSPKKKVIFTPETKPEEFDSNDLYSATYEWLEIFRDFCKRSGGFEVM